MTLVGWVGFQKFDLKKWAQTLGDLNSQRAFGHFEVNMNGALKVHVLYVLPDPGALNSCMHTFPENQGRWIYFGLTHNSVHLNVRFETLDLKLCDLKLLELTVEGTKRDLNKVCTHG